MSIATSFRASSLACVLVIVGLGGVGVGLGGCTTQSLQAKAQPPEQHVVMSDNHPLVNAIRWHPSLGSPDRQWVILAGGDHAALIEDTAPAFVTAVVDFMERPGLRQ